jgi:hypothetical protein
MKDLGKAFGAPFKDPSWFSKFVIAALFLLLSLVLIGIPIIVGYLIQVTQRVMRREEDILPGWNDIGVKFVTGFKYCIVYIVYFIPIIILILPVIALGIAGEMADEPETVAVFTVVYMFAFTLLVIPYSLLMTALGPIIAYRFALREKMSDGWNIGQIFRDFRVNWQNTLIVALIVVGIQSFAGIGIIFFIVGIFFTFFYAYLVSAYLHGLLYLELPEAERQV